ncbi:hypothetical protein [Geofilum rubicundum]|uniref:hypothetical protein n=1 Tax=Geofilum rubicundum TaxID=472113 RepID=UPI000782C9EA|nr:hypothetical protein [Geofilum rubicundum]
METKIKYWNVLCEKQNSLLFQEKIKADHISETNLVAFIKSLISKYALSDKEILEQHLNIPFKTKKDYIEVTRTNSKIGEPLLISFSAHVADISVSVILKD